MVRMSSRDWTFLSNHAHVLICMAADPGLRLRDPAVVMVPFAREGDDLVLPGTALRLPLLLVEGGPQLEALRATVHQLQTER